MSNIMQQPPEVHPPCPPWCEFPTGHEWDLWGGTDIEQRFHTLLIGEIEGGGINVSIQTLESMDDGGPSTFTPVVVNVDAAPSDVELNATQARQLAALLVLAAGRIEAL